MRIGGAGGASNICSAGSCGGGCRGGACAACKNCKNCLGCGDKGGAKNALEQLKKLFQENPADAKQGMQDAFNQDPSMGGIDMLRKLAEAIGIQIPQQGGAKA